MKSTACFKKARSCDCTISPTGHLQKNIFPSPLTPKELKLGGRELKSLCCQDLHTVTRNRDPWTQTRNVSPGLYVLCICSIRWYIGSVRRVTIAPDFSLLVTHAARVRLCGLSFLQFSPCHFGCSLILSPT